MVDILISNGTIITMNPRRTIIEDGAVAIHDDRIIDVGATHELRSRYRSDRVIDASRKVVMPGLFDGHGHAGHGLVKSMGSHRDPLWFEACERIYSEGSTEEFWYAEAMLTALERLKFGTTCGVTFLGGGDSVMRTDDAVFGDRHCKAIEKVGIREFLAVGPRRPPFPRKYCRWSGNERRDVMVSFEDQLRTSEQIIRDWHEKADGRIHICMMFPVVHPAKDDLEKTKLSMWLAPPEKEIVDQAHAVRESTKKYGVLFAQDGHAKGTVKFAHEKMGILGPDAFLSHSTDLTSEEIEICKLTDTKIVHNPSARASIWGHCPVPELIDAGVTVMLGSDGTAPDRSYDMFRHMFHCMHYQRTHYRDSSYIPPGKVLEMATIDAARALGLEKELGSIEPGKKADIILVNVFKPHTYPLNMPVHRITYYANGNDVDTVIVNGKVLMEERVVKTVNEMEVLENAQKEAEAALDRTQLRHLLEIPEKFWGHSRY